MNKLFIVLVALVSSGMASASTDMCWSHVLQDSGLQAAFPTVQFKYAAVSIDAVCVDGDTVRPFNPLHEHCVAYSNSENPVCLRTETVSLSAPLRQLVSQCVEWANYGDTPTCVKYENIEKVLPLKYDVEVYQLLSSGDGTTRGAIPLFTKEFEIPSCN